MDLSGDAFRSGRVAHENGGGAAARVGGGGTRLGGRVRIAATPTTPTTVAAIPVREAARRGTTGTGPVATAGELIVTVGGDKLVRAFPSASSRLRSAQSSALVWYRAAGSGCTQREITRSIPSGIVGSIVLGDGGALCIRLNSSVMKVPVPAACCLPTSMSDKI